MKRIIKIEANEFGGHDNMTIYTGDAPEIDGWAEIPEDFEVPSTFPFVDITVEDGVVTSMTAGVMPPPEPEPEPEGDVWDELAEAIRNGVNEVD